VLRQHHKPFATDNSDGGWRGVTCVDFFDASAATTDCLQYQTSHVSLNLHKWYKQQRRQCYYIIKFPENLQPL